MMRVKNLTPFAFGYLHCSRNPPQSEMTFIVRGRFKLAPNTLPMPIGTDAYMPEYLDDAERREVGVELDRLAQGSLTADEFEEGDDERAGEVLYPSDFAEYKPHTDVTLKGTCYARDGAATQTIVRFRVGDWFKELRVCGPRVWVDRIAGGKKTEPLVFKRLPLSYAHAFGGSEVPHNPVGIGLDDERVPPIEHMTAPADPNEPAGFAPVNPAWPQRAGKRGSDYGVTYMTERAPYYPADFDWSYFNAAPQSQQLPGYLRGDETLSFDNLHPEAARFKSRLPGLRMRVLVRDVDGQDRPIKMNLDTLHADVDEGVLSVCWRGLTPVKENDLSDVAAVLLAAEPLDEKPHPDSRYSQLLTEMIEGETDTTLFGGGDPEDLLDELDEMQDKREELAQRDPQEVSDMITKRLTPLLGEETVNNLQSLIAKTVAQIPKQRPPGGGEQPKVKNVSAALTKLEADLAKAKSLAQDEGVDTAQFAAAEQRLEKLREGVAELGMEVGHDDPAPRANCAGRDFAGHDFRGRDLRGIDLSHADLSKACLAEADLSGANLTKAILYRADLSGANFSEAQLEHTDFTLAMAPKARFERSQCNHTTFRRTDLTGASFAEAEGFNTRFSKAQMQQANGDGAKLEHALFEKCALDQASFSKASLSRCCFRESQAHHLTLEGSTLDGASIENSTLKSCNFQYVKADVMAWRKSQIDGSELSFAQIGDAHFQEVTAEHTRFYAVVMRGARFYRANLKRALLDKADLLGADFRKSSLDRASFVGASLYDAKFMEAAGVDVDFQQANLTKANFQRCKVVRK